MQIGRIKNVFPKPSVKPVLCDTRPVNMLQLLVKQREAEKEAALNAENETSKDGSENDDGEENKENM